MSRAQNSVLAFLFTLATCMLLTEDSLAGRIKYVLSLLEKSPGAKKVLFDSHSQVMELLHKQRIELPSSGIKELVRAAGRSTPTLASAAATRPVAPSRSSYSLEINVSVPDARVRIMNIRPKYHDGIKLKKGDYLIAVDKPGYRPKQFWISLGTDPAQKSYRFDVELQPVGLENCEDNLETQRYNSGIAGTNGRLFQYKARFKNTNIHDLYYSFATYSSSINYTRALYNKVSLNHAEFHLAAPTHITSDTIENNRHVEIDPNRFILSIYEFEQDGNNVILSNKTLMPAGVYVIESSKEWLCKNEFIF